MCLVFSRDWVNSILFSSLSFLPSLDRKHEGLAEMLLKQEFLWKNFQRGERRRRKSFDSLIHVLFSRSLLHYVYSLSLTSMIPFRVSWQITWCHYYFWDFCYIVYPLHCFSFPLLFLRLAKWKEHTRKLPARWLLAFKARWQLCVTNFCSYI